MRQEAKRLCDKLIADAKISVQKQEHLLQAQVSEMQLKQVNEARKLETSSAIQKSTLKEARDLLRKKAEEIDVARDALMSKKKQQDEDYAKRDMLFEAKKKKLLEDMRKQKEAWDKALADHAEALDKVKEELSMREAAIATSKQKLKLL